MRETWQLLDAAAAPKRLVCICGTGIPTQIAIVVRKGRAYLPGEGRLAGIPPAAIFDGDGALTVEQASAWTGADAEIMRIKVGRHRDTVRTPVAFAASSRRWAETLTLALSASGRGDLRDPHPNPLPQAGEGIGDQKVPMKPTSGMPGGLSSGITHEERSNSMNSSAFSCGVSAVVRQPFGNGCLPNPTASPPTCRSLITTRPHCCSGATRPAC